MTPFPEGEDMTVKRLYVALKRGDERLLKMGAHKLHEKYYSGFEFHMLDELREILNRLNEQTIPNDIRDLLTRTITNILNGIKPEYPTYQEQQGTLQIEASTPTIQTPLGPINTQTNGSTLQLTPQYEEKQEENYNQEPKAQTYSEPQPVQQTYQEQTYSNYQNNGYQAQNIKDVVVFYDDKTGFVDYDKNKAYRFELTGESLNRDTNPILNAAQVKNAVDTRVDEAMDIFWSLKNFTGNIEFITSSKSANILNMLNEYGMKFNVSNTGERAGDAKTTVYPLFGLSNVFWCPKCGKREYFVDKENKVLSLTCANCASVMYPDIYEAKDSETNAVPTNWLRALSSMSKTDTWVLINPPLESSRALVCEFLRTAFVTLQPKKVCIISKDTAIKEYYRQMLRETVQNCEVKSEFANSDMVLAEITKETALQAV